MERRELSFLPVDVVHRAQTKVAGVRARRLTPARRILAVTVSFQALYSVLGTPSAFGASTTAGVTAPRSGGLLIGLGLGVLVLGTVGFVAFTFARKKRRPSECGEQRDALASAERALQYWEGAIAHIQLVDRDRSGAAARGDEASRAGSAHADVDHESLRSKSQLGYEAAVQHRDQCQLDLINCMAFRRDTPGPRGEFTAHTGTPSSP